MKYTNWILQLGVLQVTSSQKKRCHITPDNHLTALEKMWFCAWKVLQFYFWKSEGTLVPQQIDCIEFKYKQWILQFGVWQFIPSQNKVFTLRQITIPLCLKNVILSLERPWITFLKKCGNLGDCSLRSCDVVYTCTLNKPWAYKISWVYIFIQNENTLWFTCTRKKNCQAGLLHEH